MKNTLSHLNTKLLRIIRTVGKEADRRKLPAYVVGGAVRDILLGKRNLDLDFSFEGNAITLAKVLAKKSKARLIIYKEFKTASLRWPGGIRVDLATARKERYAHSGALPAVVAGTLREDLLRRDFTINAMAIAINANGFGQLIDEFGGLRDLSGKKIRVLHDQSFIDDPTRILRAVRFEQRLGFQIERKTLIWMKSALRTNMDSHVKPPRYFAEFKKNLCEENPLKSLKRLHDMGGLRFLNVRPKFHFQELSRMRGRIQKVRRKLPYMEYDHWWLVYFIGFITRCSDRDINRLLGRLPFTKTEQKSVHQSRKSRDLIKRLSSTHLTASQAYQVLKPLTAGSISYLRVCTSNTVVCRRIDRYLSGDIHVKLKINGEDLKRIGIPSGVKMGKILESVLCSKIDRHIRSKRDELKKALQLAGKMSNSN